MQSQDSVLISRLLEFYSDKRNLDIFKGVAGSSGSKVSLRLMDWFSTNYSRENRVYINDVDVHADYKNKLGGYRKKAFDPFCRKDRIYLFSDAEGALTYSTTKDSEDCIVTTVGQLHFFMWSIQRGVIDYIIDNVADIEKSMAKRSKRKPATVLRTVKDITVTF